MIKPTQQQIYEDFYKPHLQVKITMTNGEVVYGNIQDHEPKGVFNRDIKMWHVKILRGGLEELRKVKHSEIHLIDLLSNALSSTPFR